MFSKKWFFPVLAGSLFLSGCSGSPPEESASQADLFKIVRTAPVSAVDWEDTKEQVAEVLPSLQMEVVLKAGGDVTRVVKRKGDKVREGDVIVELDQTDILRQKQKLELSAAAARDQLELARQELEDNLADLRDSITKAQNTLDEIGQDYNKMRNDYDAGLVSERELEMMEHRLQSVRLELDSLIRKKQRLETNNPVSALETQWESSRIALDEMERTLSYYQVKAPASGILTEMPVEEGMTLPGGSKIGRIERTDPVKIRAQLTDALLARVQGKQELDYRIPGETGTGKAKVVYLAEVADPATRTYALELEAPNPDGKLKPGARVYLLLSDTGRKRVVAVPSPAVLHDNGQAYVYVLSGNYAEKRFITLGRTREHIVEVTEGLKEGEQLVVSGMYQLKDGERVEVENGS